MLTLERKGFTKLAIHKRKKIQTRSSENIPGLNFLVQFIKVGLFKLKFDFALTNILFIFLTTTNEFQLT